MTTNYRSEITYPKLSSTVYTNSNSPPIHQDSVLNPCGDEKMPVSLEPCEYSIPHIWPWKDEAIDYTLASCLINVASIRTICNHL